MDEEKFPSNLTEAEALRRLKINGPNDLPQARDENFWNRGKSLIKEPMILLLVLTASIYLLLGDLGEGLLLCGSVFAVIGLTLYQERKSERALAALRDLSSPRALVIRDNIEKRISAKDLVEGDLVVLHEGDRVPADGLVLRSSHLSLDESLLTGENLPVKKRVIEESSVHGFDETEEIFKVFSSTLSVAGSALIRVVRTGVETEVGKIGKSLESLDPEKSNLASEIKQIVKLFGAFGLIVCTSLIVMYGFKYGEWTQALLVGLATQMALLPEEFPVVLTIFLAMGAWRLSKVNVLVRKSDSIERLGAITALCVDKTGTLTRNLMSVSALSTGVETFRIDTTTSDRVPELFHGIVEFGILASHRDPFDPMEKAIRRLAETKHWGHDHLHEEWKLIQDYPLSEKLLAMSCVWTTDPGANQFIIAAKGAPEAIMDLCHLDKSETEKMLAATTQMAKEGLRILGVAKAQFPQASLPTDQHDFIFEWVGLIGLEDPLRDEVPAALESCRRAGIRVIMMTGDYVETALKIAERAGIDTSQPAVVGKDLKLLSDEDFREMMRSTNIFARMIPDQKLRIVKALKQDGEVVAMTGDGVNDAPSLKWADVGIAMGARGTDVAREASGIVLTDDNFASIVAGIERGRIIFSNIRKAMSYIISVHVPIAGLSILPVFFNWPLLLLPAHIVFLELIIDPVCAILFESQNYSENIMRSPPRSLKVRLFSAKDLLRSFLQGTFILTVTAVAYVLFSDAHPNSDPAQGRAFAFGLLVLSNIGLIFSDISGGSFYHLGRMFKNITNILIVIGLVAVLLLGVQVQPLSGLFKFSPLDLNQWMLMFAISIVLFLVLNLWNKFSERKAGGR